MADWKKIIVSGSDADVRSINSDTGFSGSFSGSFQGDGSQLTGIVADGGVSEELSIVYAIAFG